MAADPARQSVLDLVKRDADRLAANLGVRDREKLIEYQESVRALELRIAAAELAPRQSLTAADAPQKACLQTTPTMLR